MGMARLKEKEAFQVLIREFFQEADTSGDGLLSLDELEAILENPSVQAWLGVLQLEIHEVSALFAVLDDNGDGEVSLDEFLGGAMRMKGDARALDSIAIMHEQNKIRSSIAELKDCFQQSLKEELGKLRSKIRKVPARDSPCSYAWL